MLMNATRSPASRKDLSDSGRCACSYILWQTWKSIIYSNCTCGGSTIAHKATYRCDWKKGFKSRFEDIMVGWFTSLPSCFRSSHAIQCHLCACKGCRIFNCIKHLKCIFKQNLMFQEEQVYRPGIEWRIQVGMSNDICILDDVTLRWIVTHMDV